MGQYFIYVVELQNKLREEYMKFKIEVTVIWPQHENQLAVVVTGCRGVDPSNFRT